MLDAKQMTNATLQMNLRLYKDNWETISDAQRYVELLEERINRLERTN